MVAIGFTLTWPPVKGSYGRGKCSRASARTEITRGHPFRRKVLRPKCVPRPNLGLVRQWSEAEAAAQALRLTLLPVELRGPEDFESAFTKMTQARTQAL